MKVAHQLKQIAERRAARSLFEGRGAKTEPLSLLEAVYFDRTELAKAIIEADPEQVRQQDPFAGLTPLHLAIFRQNAELVQLLAAHARTDISATDCFGRKPIDLCIYTLDDQIIRMIATPTAIFSDKE